MTQEKLLKILVLVITVLFFLCAVLFAVWMIQNANNPDRIGSTETEKVTDTATEKAAERVTETQTETGTEAVPVSVVLPQTEDAGLAYQDSVYFLGESTTAHLRSRGVLSGGKESAQVWVGPANTLTLDLNITRQKISYIGSPDEGCTVAEAAAAVKPKYLVLCFGLNGIVSFHGSNMGKQLFFTAYKQLIAAVREASPSTVIILQGAYPVAADADTHSNYAYSVSPEVLNAYLVDIRAWTQEIAADEGLSYLDTPSVLADASGALIPEYSDDGIHLTVAGYRTVLRYLRTHAYSN